jgi:hypothetical protein
MAQAGLSARDMPRKNSRLSIDVGMPLCLSPDESLSRTELRSESSNPARDGPGAGPMRVLRILERFDYPNFIFKPKIEPYLPILACAFSCCSSQ